MESSGKKAGRTSKQGFIYTPARSDLQFWSAFRSALWPLINCA